MYFVHEKTGDVKELSCNQTYQKRYAQLHDPLGKGFPLSSRLRISSAGMQYAILRASLFEQQTFLSTSSWTSNGSISLVSMSTPKQKTPFRCAGAGFR